MYIIASLISILAQLYALVIILQVLLNWLIAFDIVNSENEAAQNLTTLLKKLTDPVFTPIRKYIPPVGGFDLTPLVVLIALQITTSIIISIIT